MRQITPIHEHPDIHWDASGQVGLSGRLRRYYEHLDRHLRQTALADGCDSHDYPAFISARILDKVGYFASFPHLATFPVSLQRDHTVIDTFINAPMAPNGEIQADGLQAPSAVLTPAACYHVYPRLADQVLSTPYRMTLKCRCFRREDTTLPLMRMTNFRMREFVCIGSRDAVKAHLDVGRRVITELLQSLNIPFQFEVATDPFFNPHQNAKYLLQTLDPVKHECVYQGHPEVDALAIASLNFHKTFFGETFNIRDEAGDHVYSGCVAFGLERWLSAFLREFGPDVDIWPALTV